MRNKRASPGLSGYVYQVVGAGEEETVHVLQAWMQQRMLRRIEMLVAVFETNMPWPQPRAGRWKPPLCPVPVRRRPDQKRVAPPALAQGGKLKRQGRQHVENMGIADGDDRMRSGGNAVVSLSLWFCERQRLRR